MTTEMLKLFSAFDRAHHCAVQLDQSESISNARLDAAWAASNKARLALMAAIEKLEEQATASTATINKPSL